MALVEDLHGPRQLSVAGTLNNLAAVQQFRGRPKQAEAMYRRALDIAVEHLGERHPKVGFTLNNLAALLANRRPVDAATLYRRALAIFRRALGPAHPNVGVCLENYAAVLRRLGLQDQAAAAATRAVRILARVEAVNGEAVG